MKKYALELSEKQCAVLINALDLYQRIGMGQIDEIRRVAVPAPGYGTYGMDHNVVDTLINLLKQELLGWEHIGTSHSILSNDIPDDFRVAWDIQQVVRHRLAHDGLKPGEKLGIYVYFDTPRRYSKEELPAIKAVESLDNE